MSDRKEIIEKYSRIISFRYKRYGWAAGVVLAIGVFLNVWFDSVLWLMSMTSGIIALGLAFLWYSLHHRYILLLHFNIRNADAFQQLEKYIREKSERWDQMYPFILGFMLLLGLTMVLMLFFMKDSKWTAIIVVMFISLILAFMAKGWLDFNDEIVVHDIRRSMPDQTSE